MLPMFSVASLGPISEEYAGAELGDRRRTERAKSIAESLYRQPTSGFPRALSSSAELEAFYRFINSDGFSASDIVEPHIGTSVARAKAQSDHSSHLSQGGNEFGSYCQFLQPSSYCNCPRWTAR